MRSTTTLNYYLKTAYAVFTCMFMLLIGTSYPAHAQEDCSISVTGCPPANLVGPICATKDSNGVLGATVNWTPPRFSLNCSGPGGSGYAFNMEFDLNESLSAEGCWVYNKVQRVGTDGGKLRLWQSTGTGDPWVQTPAFYLTDTTDMQMTIESVEEFTVYVYMINTTTGDSTLGATINIPISGPANYPFYVVPPTPDGYKFAFVFVGGSNNSNVVQVLSINATVIDDCTGDVNFFTTSNYNPPKFFPVGTTTVTYTATCNSCTNPGPLTSTCSFDVTINGVKASIVGTTDRTCGLSDGTVTFDTTLANASQVQYSLNGGTWTTITSPFTITGLGEGNYTLNVRAYFDNSANYCSIFTPLNFSIGTSVDATPPNITCPTPAASYATNPGQCTSSQSFTATATDLCDPSPTITYFIGMTQISFPYSFPLGTTTVKAVATDAANNTSECSFNVLVVDNTNPTVVSCASPQSATTGAVNCTALVPDFTADVTAIDNCTDSDSLTITQSPVAGTSVGIGVHPITITVTDKSGNSVTCNPTFTVTDNVAPTIITCPTSRTAVAGANCTAPVPNFTTAVVATDLCTPANSLSITQSPAVGAARAVGTYTITITVRDQGGNATTCTTSFTVTPNTNPPTVNCPANITAPDDGCGTAELSITPATATNSCSPPVTVTGVRSDGLDLTDPYPIGITTITWTATDTSNNSSSCTQTITITKSDGTILANYSFIGFTAYPFNANETAFGINSHVNSTEDFNYTGSGTPTGPQAFKVNEGTNEALVLQPSSGYNTRWIDFVVGGSTLKFYSQFHVYFQAGRNPHAGDTLTLAYSLDSTNYINVGTLLVPTQTEWYEGVFDLSGIAALNTYSLSNIYFRIYVSGSDDNGNGDDTRLEIDNFQVKAAASRPAITCPENKSVTVTAAADCSATVDPGTATGEDKCGAPVITASRSDGMMLGDPYPIGTTTITWTATDIDENTATCTQTITVTGLIDAVDDSFTPANPGVIGNALGNDYINCQAPNGSTVTISVITPASTPNVTLNTSNGDVMAVDGTEIGTYTIQYKICSIAEPTKCDSAIIKVIVDHVLPVSGLVLKGNRNSADVHLNWQTLTEQNTSYFIMERSFDGIRFEPVPVGSKVPAAGNSNAMRNYNLVDRNVLADMVYYRVKLYDNNGNMKMSNLVAITMNFSKKLRVFPNPVKDFVTIEFGENGTYQIDLISDIGQLITLQKEVQVTNSFRTMTLQRNNLISGQYQMRIWNKTTGSVNTFRLVYLPRLNP